MAAPGDIGEQISRAGLTFHRDLIPPSTGERVTRGPELVELIQDAERLDEWIGQLLLGGVGEQVEAIAGWLKREGADAVAIDPLYYAAAIAAHGCGLPWVSVSNSLNPVLPDHLDSALLRTVGKLGPRRAELFREYGFSPAFRGCDVLSPHRTIAFATEALVGEAVAGVALVGPSFPLHERGDEVAMRPLPEDRPVVYTSFGSQIYYWPQLFEKLREAGQRVGAHMVFSMGDLAGEVHWPDCDVYAYAPQLAILRRASVFVTHGGANSVMEAAACAVPMLVSPMCNDQFHQAWFVARAGVGCVEDLVPATVERIADRLRYLLMDAGVRERAARLAQSYRTDGARRAATLIARLGEA